MLLCFYFVTFKRTLISAFFIRKILFPIQCLGICRKLDIFIQYTIYTYLFVIYIMYIYVCIPLSNIHLTFIATKVLLTCYIYYHLFKEWKCEGFLRLLSVLITQVITFCILTAPGSLFEKKIKYNFSPSFF